MGFDEKQASPDKKTGLTYKGREITLSFIRGYPMRRHRTPKGWYEETHKIHAAALYFATGDIAKSAELSKVPPTALKRWLNEDWFLALMEELRRENNAKIEAKFNSILEKAIDQVEDRVANGNFQFDQKNSEVIRIPASLRDLTQVTATIVDKRQTIQGKDESGQGNISAVQRLENLANQFEKMVGKSKPKLITDVEFKEIPNGNAKSDMQGDAFGSQGLIEGVIGDDRRESGVIETVHMAEKDIGSRAELQTT